MSLFIRLRFCFLIRLRDNGKMDNAQKIKILLFSCGWKKSTTFGIFSVISRISFLICRLICATKSILKYSKIWINHYFKLSCAKFLFSFEFANAMNTSVTIAQSLMLVVPEFFSQIRPLFLSNACTDNKFRTKRLNDRHQIS